MAQDTLPAALTEQLGFLLGRAHLAHRAVAERALGPLRLSGKELGALSILIGEGPLSQQRLSERQGIDRTTMVAVVDALERHGYVERRRDPADRRSYALHPTAAGRRAVAKAARATQRAEDEFLAPIPAAERRRLKQLLRTLIASHAATTSADRAP
jgi:DNA-binding MarR family transcriptional regulator